jgi:RHS repeat-associated protein
VTIGTHRSEFTYNGLNQRVKIVEKENETVSSTKQLVWIPGDTQPSEERDASNSVTKRYYPQGMQVGSINYYYTRDHLGSIRELTDSSGTVQTRYDYDPYGRRTKVSGDLDADFGFTGHYFHQASALHLALYRAYDADLGRWISRDPIGEQGGINLYDYSFNDPLNNVDPSGLDIAIAIGFAAGLTSPFGHVAGAVTGQGTFSYGTKEAFGSSFTDYLQNQSMYRDTSVFVLPATKDQDDAFVAAFKKVASTGKSRVGNDCADAVSAGLKAAGLLNPNAAQTFPSMINGYMELSAMEGEVSAIVIIPQGVPATSSDWSTVNQLLGSFNP